MNVYSPPYYPYHKLGQKRLFLAGSIEMGKARNWQEEVIGMFDKYAEIDILNPRRSDWKSSWEQEFHNPQFFQQATWELDGLESATHILFYFDKDTQSPITLLELGLLAKSGKKIVVVCDTGFWRKGNVDIICYKYRIEQVHNLQRAINYLLKN